MSSSVLYFFLPVYFDALWLYACDHANGYPEDVELYKSYLPPLLRGRFTTIILSFILCTTAFTLNIGNLKSTNRVLKIVSWLIVIVSGILGFLNLFSMM